MATAHVFVVATVVATWVVHAHDRTRTGIRTCRVEGGCARPTISVEREAIESRGSRSCSQAASAEGGLGAVSHLHLGKNFRDMVLHGFQAEPEIGGDFGVAASGCD